MYAYDLFADSIDAEDHDPNEVTDNTSVTSTMHRWSLPGVREERMQFAHELVEITMSIRDVIRGEPRLFVDAFYKTQSTFLVDVKNNNDKAALFKLRLIVDFLVQKGLAARVEELFQKYRARGILLNIDNQGTISEHFNVRRD